MNRERGAGSARVSVRRHGDRQVAGDELDEVAVEEPLLISLAWPGGDKAVSVTMRTPGDDARLALGFLFGEGIVDTTTAIDRVAVAAEGEQGAQATVHLQSSPDSDLLAQERNFYMTSSCGVCGKAALDAVKTRSGYELSATAFSVSADVVSSLPDRLLEQQALFAGTGSIHAAGFFNSSGDCEVVFEDVGRHNAVDKLVGSALEDQRLPAGDRCMVVSGRASFELVQKAGMAGCPLLVAVGAPSSLAIELAWELGMTLVGFVRADRFNVYSVPGRIGDLS